METEKCAPCKWPHKKFIFQKAAADWGPLFERTTPLEWRAMGTSPQFALREVSPERPKLGLMAYVDGQAEERRTMWRLQNVWAKQAQESFLEYWWQASKQPKHCPQKRGETYSVLRARITNCRRRCKKPWMGLGMPWMSFRATNTSLSRS